MSDLLNMLNTPSLHFGGVLAFLLVGFRTYQILTYHKYHNHVATKVAHVVTMLALSVYLAYVWITPEPVYFQYGIMFPQTESILEIVVKCALVSLILTYIGARAHGDLVHH